MCGGVAVAVTTCFGWEGKEGAARVSRPRRGSSSKIERKSIIGWCSESAILSNGTRYIPTGPKDSQREALMHADLLESEHEMWADLSDNAHTVLLYTYSSGKTLYLHVAIFLTVHDTTAPPKKPLAQALPSVDRSTDLIYPWPFISAAAIDDGTLQSSLDESQIRYFPFILATRRPPSLAALQTHRSELFYSTSTPPTHPPTGRSFRTSVSPLEGTLQYNETVPYHIKQS